MKALTCLLLVLLLLPSGAMAVNTRKDVTLEIAPLYQGDYQKVLFTYNKEGKTVASSGCGAVCLSMAMSYLDKTVAQDPESLMMWAFLHDYYKGTGLSCKTMTQILEDYGFCGKWLSKEPLLPVRKALEAGCPVIAYVGEGYFSSAGHYILIYGIDPTGHFRVIDPNSEKRSLKAYRSEFITGQITSSFAFLVCSPVSEIEEVN